MEKLVLKGEAELQWYCVGSKVMFGHQEDKLASLLLNTDKKKLILRELECLW